MWVPLLRGGRISGGGKEKFFSNPHQKRKEKKATLRGLTDQRNGKRR